MCGIFAYVGQDRNAYQVVLQGLKTLEYRGYDSWGIAGQNQNSNFFIKKRVGKIGKANVAGFPNSNFAFGHTRWATHGKVTEVNAHPQLDCSGSLALIHNGIIENYETLKKKLINNRHRFISETDTEVAIHQIEELKKSYSLFEAVRKMFLEVNGLNAFIVADSKTRTFVAVRNGSPLVFGAGKQGNYIASDAIALLAFTKHVYFMEDNDLVVFSKNRIELYNSKSGKRRKIKYRSLNWKTSETQKGNFPHFMLKEIHQQPDLIAEIAESDHSYHITLARKIDRAFGTYMVGCGSACYACIAGTYLFSKIAKRHLNWSVGSEFGYCQEFLTKDSLVMALSQSGETIDILEAIKKAKSKQAKILALVNVLGSSLYREADYKMLIGVGPEKAVATTKAFTGKLAHLLLMAYSIAGNLKQGEKYLLLASRAGKKLLTPFFINQLKKLADTIKHKKNVYVIGRGLSYPVALETALKIKEISYIHAEGFAAGELKHGAIALIEKGSPCIAFLPDDETYGANLAGAMEMKARGAIIIGISSKPHEVFDHFISIEESGEATVIPHVIAGQLLAYELAVAKGLDPDMPRNLAKSVTVK